MKIMLKLNSIWSFLRIECGKNIILNLDSRNNYNVECHKP